MFEFVHESVAKFRSLNDGSGVIISDWLMLLGASLGAWLLLKLVMYYSRIFKLYVWARYIWRTDYVKRYGKWAIVTGSTDGIGFEISKELARRGHSIVMVGISDSKLASSKPAIEALCHPDSQVVCIQIDLSTQSLDEYQRLANKLDLPNRDIGILVNNAGMASHLVARFHRHLPTTIIDMLNVNCLALAQLTRMVLPGMLLRNRGLILNISSVLGDKAFVGVYGNIYSPTKAFVQQLSRQLQQEYRNYPIDIVDCNCGFINGGLWARETNKNWTYYVMTTPDRLAKCLVSCLVACNGFIPGHPWNEYQIASYKWSRFFQLGWLVRYNFILRSLPKQDLTPKVERNNS